MSRLKYIVLVVCDLPHKFKFFFQFSGAGTKLGPDQLTLIILLKYNGYNIVLWDVNERLSGHSFALTYCYLSKVW